MRTHIWIACALFIGAGVPASAQKELSSASASLAEEIAATGKHQVAVVDFTDLQGNVTELGRFIAEEVALGLVTSKARIAVIDRTHLKALLQEHKLASSGIIDPATARKLGEIAGVDALVTGTITPLGDSVRLVAKVLDTASARILAATSIELAKTRTIEELMARDIRSEPYTRPVAGGAETTPRDKRPPTYESDSLRVTAGEVGVTACNDHASLSVILENISRELLQLAIAKPDSDYYHPLVSLSDDRGSKWTVESMSGLETLLPRTDAKYREYIRAGENFTLIPPGGRSAMVMHFANGNCFTMCTCGNHGEIVPGSSFSFSAQGIRFSPSGSTGLSVGLTGIKGTVVKNK